MTGRLLPLRRWFSTGSIDTRCMITTRRKMLAATLAALGLALGVGPSGPSGVNAARELRAPIGAITGVAQRPGLSVTIAATTDPGRLGEATVARDGRQVTVRLDCVRTYTALGVTLMVPAFNEVGYASGIGSDGRRWYLYFNEAYSFEARTEPGPPTSIDTCGVGYEVGSGVHAVQVTGERVIAWTLVG